MSIGGRRSAIAGRSQIVDAIDVDHMGDQVASTSPALCPKHMNQPINSTNSSPNARQPQAPEPSTAAVCPHPYSLQLRPALARFNPAPTERTGAPHQPKWGAGPRFTHRAMIGALDQRPPPAPACAGAVPGPAGPDDSTGSCRPHPLAGPGQSQPLARDRSRAEAEEDAGRPQPRLREAQRLHAPPRAHPLRGGGPGRILRRAASTPGSTASLPTVSGCPGGPGSSLSITGSPCFSHACAFPVSTPPMATRA